MSYIQRDEMPGYLTIIRTYNGDGHLIATGYSTPVEETVEERK